MTVNFASNGTKFTLLIVSEGRQAREERANNIRPDPNLWSKRSRRKSGAALTSRKWHNQYSQDQVRCLDDPEKPVRARGERSHYAKPKAIEFTDRPEYR